MQVTHRLFLCIAIISFVFLLNQIPFDGFHLKVDSSTKQKSFQSWMQYYGFKYANEQVLLYRQSIWLNNSKTIQHLNSLQNLSYSVHHNRFTDLTSQEFIHRYGLHQQYKTHNNFNITLTCQGNISIAPHPPTTLDWSTKIVTPVVNQGECGSNWALTAVGAIEGLYALKMGQLVQLSDQQLVDCSGDYGNQGCSGGFMDQAFWYVIDHGIATSQAYPRTGTFDKCRYTPVMKFTKFSRCAKVTTSNHTKLLSAIVQQPTSVAIDASGIQMYKEGVFNGKCTTDVNVGMLLVGYGQQSGTPFWKLKSSFGVDWGYKGYLLLHKDNNDDAGKCGIRLAASVPQQLL